MKTDHKAEEMVYTCKAVMILWTETGHSQTEVIVKGLQVMRDVYGLSPDEATELIAKYKGLGDSSKKERRKLRETVEYLREGMEEKTARVGRFQNGG